MSRWMLLVAVALILAAAGSSPASSTRDNVARTATTCPITLPNGQTFPSQGRDRYGYRHGQLWVELWPYGITFAGKADVTSNGWLGIKFPWYRHSRGRLRITATRLDKPAPHARSRVPAGYGAIGFQSSAVYFPSEGCWRITGTAGAARLSFVTAILRTKTVHDEVPNG